MARLRVVTAACGALCAGLGGESHAGIVRLPTAYCLLPTAYCLLPTAYCLLPTAYCLLPTAYCLLPTAAVG
ncbi:hypothetical protein GBS0709_13880 [Edwardsiella tarda]|nr:hypothetical protein GBS0709_13880 [Edwardsiella tarda]